MKKYSCIAGFFIGTPLTLFLAIFTLSSISKNQIAIPVIPQVLPASTQILSGLPPESQIIVASPHTSDARAIIVQKYLQKYSSPLEPYSQIIVDISDKYNLDYRLLVAIAQQESNLCKKIPTDSHNCWGYGIYGDLVTKFDNYPEAMETVASGLKRNYLDKGLDTPEKIMAKYTPPSVIIGGPWARGVSTFLTDME
jgi:hypothetical protein